jgi:hypothetical protein
MPSLFTCKSIFKFDDIKDGGFFQGEIRIRWGGFEKSLKEGSVVSVEPFLTERDLTYFIVKV